MMIQHPACDQPRQIMNSQQLRLPKLQESLGLLAYTVAAPNASIAKGADRLLEYEMEKGPLDGCG